MDHSMTAWETLNLLLTLALSLCAVGALAYCFSKADSDSAVKGLLGIGLLPSLGMVRSALVKPVVAGRALAEVVVFGAAGLGLAASGLALVGVVIFMAFLLNASLTLVVQRAR